MRRLRPDGTWASVGRRRRLAWWVAVVLVSSGCAPARPALHRVTIQGFRFEPAEMKVARGDTVEWINRDIVPHTATADRGAWDSSGIAAGASWRWVVTGAAGDASYTCRFHPTMKGRLVTR